MPYQGLIFAAMLGVGLAVAITLFLTNTTPQPETHDEGNRKRRGYKNRWESKDYQQDECPICHDSLRCTYLQLQTLDCGHKYHRSCIQKWFAQTDDPRCPLCRKPSKK